MKDLLESTNKLSTESTESGLDERTPKIGGQQNASKMPEMPFLGGKILTKPMAKCIAITEIKIKTGRYV